LKKKARQTLQFANKTLKFFLDNSNNSCKFLTEEIMGVRMFFALKFLPPPQKKRLDIFKQKNFPTSKDLSTIFRQPKFK